MKRVLWAVATAIVFSTSVAQAIDGGPAGLPCSEPMPALRRGAFRLEVGRVRLRDGVAYTRVGKPCDPSGDLQCEFAINLTRAEQFGTRQKFLLAVVNTDHRLGSGAWDSVLVYVCRNRSYVQVFGERYFYGARVILGSASDMWVTSGVWSAGDPSCCPSQEKDVHYVWSSQRRRFAVAGSTLRALPR